MFLSRSNRTIRTTKHKINYKFNFYNFGIYKSFMFVIFMWKNSLLLLNHLKFLNKLYLIIKLIFLSFYHILISPIKYCFSKQIKYQGTFFITQENNEEKNIDFKNSNVKKIVVFKFIKIPFFFYFRKKLSKNDWNIILEKTN